MLSTFVLCGISSNATSPGAAGGGQGGEGRELEQDQDQDRLQVGLNTDW